MPIDVEKYERELRDSVGKIKELMLQEWGYAPDVEISVEPTIMVRAKFNIKGFQHKGQSKKVSEKTAASYRKPALLAMSIMGEVSAHRNTCADCGERIPAFYERHSHALAIIGEVGDGTIYGFNSKNGTREYQVAGDPPTITETINYGGKERTFTRTNYVRVRLPLIMPDAIERMANPRKSKVFDEAAKVAAVRGFEVRLASACVIAK